MYSVYKNTYKRQKYIFNKIYFTNYFSIEKQYSLLIFLLSL